VEYGLSKIVDGDVILTYARSSVVELLLQSAQAHRISFRVIVVDSRPMLEGRQLLQRLSSAGVECTYVMLSAISYIMRVRVAVWARWLRNCLQVRF
jgi:translation initiation factor eIF-2B subunit delta